MPMHGLLFDFNDWIEGNQNKNNYLVSNFYKKIEISRAFLPPVSSGEKSGKFQNVVEIAHKAVILNV